MNVQSRFHDEGFALVGVVMFILVLTILGLSLFSLSGYEAKFMFDSLDRSEALYAAQSGLERARFALVRTDSLQGVSRNLPLDGVEYARALQGATMSGAVDWQGDPILICVRARVGKETRTLKAEYTPAQIKIYDRLMTLSDPDSGLRVYRVSHDDPTEERWQNVYLYGEILQKYPNPTGLPGDRIFGLGSGAYPAAWPNGVTVSAGEVATPDVQTYFGVHFEPAMTAMSVKDGARDVFTLNASGPDNVAFYRSNGNNYSLDVRDERPEIRVNGTAIWMFPRGFRVEKTIQVTGSVTPDDDMLVLVAGQHLPSFTGFMFHGSLHSPVVPVILVTDGRVVLQNHLDVNEPTTIGWLSIYAAKAFLMGPIKPGGGPQPQMRFSHPPTHATIDPLLEKLANLGVLPHLQGGVRGKLAHVAGTWREVAEGDSL